MQGYCLEEMHECLSILPAFLFFKQFVPTVNYSHIKSYKISVLKILVIFSLGGSGKIKAAGDYCFLVDNEGG
jgi:hypothetical protein